MTWEPLPVFPISSSSTSPCPLRSAQILEYVESCVPQSYACAFLFLKHFILLTPAILQVPVNITWSLWAFVAFLFQCKRLSSIIISFSFLLFSFTLSGRIICLTSLSSKRAETVCFTHYFIFKSNTVTDSEFPSWLSRNKSN